MLGAEVRRMDLELQAQQAAEQHIAACWEYLHDDAPEPENLLAPFCGCQTCEVRETLHAAYPYLREAILAEVGLSPQ